MARGDWTTVISANLGAGSSFDRQPASGKSERITDYGTGEFEGSAPNMTPAVELNRVDGTNNDAQLEYGNTGSNATYAFRSIHVFDNTNYARITNATGTSYDTTICLIEL